RGAFESNIGTTATVLSVTNTNDAGIGSLRQALIDANAAPNLNEIRFNISGACPRTITLASLLPDIVHPVRIDGYTQSGASRNTAVLGWNANLCIVLNGANQITGAYGFNINTGASPDATVSIEGIAFSGHSFAAAQFIAGRDHRFVGNQIGGVVGSTALIASGTGVRIGGSVEGVRVGGPEPGDRNVIANTLGIGVNLSGSGSTQPSGAVVENNYIGTQSGGDVRGGQRGVFIASPDHLIRGNVIVNASSHGIELSGSLAVRNRIVGNRIGVPAVCSGNCVSRGNSGHGVFIRNSAHDNRIESNLIAHSGLDGIAVTGARRNSLRRNTMYEQSGIGIDLGDDGRNLFNVNNSAAAPIVAGNDSQNAPSLGSVAGTAAVGLAEGALTSANGWYRIDFYGIPSTTGCSLVIAGQLPVGFFGEGRDWLGSTFLQISNGTQITDGSASFSEVELRREGSSSYFVAGSTWITATATRLSCPPLLGAYSHRGTSEFGRCRQYTAGTGPGPSELFSNGFEG
ncbi:MAG: right-handed parallel beta-helix repeat-containing protein, partial [Aquimonas sp.]|nr:right-handed parallel beta-helix repeat-containing protein [Aquimonas sp.]